MSESILSNYKLELEDRPLKITPFARMGGKDSKMSKESTPEVVKTPKAKYSKTRGEHIKDVVIAVLIAGIIAFVGGMTFQGNQQEAINTAVKGAQTVAPAEVKK